MVVARCPNGARTGVVEHFTSILTNAERRDFFITAREAMLGLALGRATDDGKPLGHERRVLARLRAEALAIDT